MDVKKLQEKLNKVNEEEKKNMSRGELNNSQPYNEAEIDIEVDEKEINKYLDKYLMGEHLEKECNIRGKIKYTLRSPSSAQQDLSDTVLYNTEGLTAGKLPTVINNHILALHIIRYNDIDFIKEQGDAYNTEEGFRERIDIILKKTIPPVRSQMMRDVDIFIKTLTKVFSNESLKNS